MADGCEIKYFYCKLCKFPFRSETYHSEGETLVSPCPVCDLPAGQSNHHVFNLKKAWQNSTGPKTPEGKARVSLNSWKTGIHAQPHFLAPAKPGKYPLCASCELLESCKNEKYKYCPKDFETALQFMSAYREGNVDNLRELAGWSQAQMLKVFSMMVHDILSRGVQMECKKVDENGNESTFYEKNQLVKELPGYIETLGFSAQDQVMTPRTVEQKEALQGHIRAAEITQVDEVEVKRQHFDELKKMREAIEKLNIKKSLKDE